MNGKTVLASGLVLAILGMAAGIPYMSLTGAYLALMALLLKLYVRTAVQRLNCSREFEPCRAFSGDTVMLKIQIENLKPFPVFWLKYSDQVPNLGFFDSVPFTSHTLGKTAFSNAMHLKWFERVEHTYLLSRVKRGVFKFGPIRLTVEDPLGFETHNVVLHHNDTLTVYPRLHRIKGLSWADEFPFGIVPRQGWLHPDPLAIAGTRPYDGSTPASSIAWKATAKTGELRVKLQEPTLQSKAIIALNLSTSRHYWEGIDAKAMEDAISIAASLCINMLNRGMAFGLAVNSIGTHNGSLFIGPGSSEAHLQRILESLAHLTLPWHSFSGTLRRLGKQINPDTAVLAVISYLSESDGKHLLDLAASGYPVTALWAQPPHDAVGACHSLSKDMPTYVCLGLIETNETEVLAFERVN